MNASDLLQEAELRARVVAEAQSWVRTPWHHMAQRKGVGVDCAQLLMAVFRAAGLEAPVAVGHYPPDWHLHRAEPRFLAVLRLYAYRIETDPMPGDVAMFRFGRHAAHGAIVIEWPRVVHAWIDERMVIESDVSKTPRLADRLDGCYRLNAFKQGDAQP